MNIFQAAILGVVQGFTEFLPVSSSGHLVLFQELLNIEHGTVFFDIFVHFATLLAVLIYFRKAILSITKKELFAIVVASAPAGIVGLLFEDQITAAFSSVVLVGMFLIFSGTLNFVTDFLLRKQSIFKETVGLREALFIGLFQALAILPGISRSGSTVSAGIMQHLERKTAFRFSFLMVIPVILGANLAQLIKVLQGQALAFDITIFLIGGLFAFVSGLLSLRLFEYVIVKAKINFFGWYCVILGLSVVFYNSVILN